MTDFNGMSTRLKLFYAKKLWNHIVVSLEFFPTWSNRVGINEGAQGYRLSKWI